MPRRGLSQHDSPAWGYVHLFTEKTLSFGTGIPIINLRRSSGGLRFIMGIHIPLSVCLWVNRSPGWCLHRAMCIMYHNLVNGRHRIPTICLNTRLVSSFLVISTANLSDVMCSTRLHEIIVKFERTRIYTLYRVCSILFQRTIRRADLRSLQMSI